MTLNTILHTPIQNEVNVFSGRPLAVNKLLEELSDEELDTLEAMLGGGLVTMEKIKVLHYRAAAGTTGT